MENKIGLKEWENLPKLRGIFSYTDIILIFRIRYRYLIRKNVPPGTVCEIAGRLGLEILLERANPILHRVYKLYRL